MVRFNMTAFFLAAMLAKQSTRAFQSRAATRNPLRAFSIGLGSSSEEVRRSNLRLFSTSVDLDDLNVKIQAKGDEIRRLKADGIDKELLAPHVQELQALKALLPPTETPAPVKKAAKPEKPKKVSQPKKKVDEMSESELRLNRVAKIEAMRQANVEPFEYTFQANRSAAKLAAEYEGRLADGEEDMESDVSVAGRIMTRRVFGKLAFITLQDETGIIQLQFDAERLGDSFKVCEVFFPPPDETVVLNLFSMCKRRIRRLSSNIFSQISRSCRVSRITRMVVTLLVSVELYGVRTKES